MAIIMNVLLRMKIMWLTRKKHRPRSGGIAFFVMFGRSSLVGTSPVGRS